MKNESETEKDRERNAASTPNQFFWAGERKIEMTQMNKTGDDAIGGNE